MLLRLAASILSALLLASGWLSMTGLTLPVAFIPLLWISGSYGSSRREWWGMFGWAALTFVLWNALTVWWIWFATPVGPPAAVLASTTLNMIAFMLFHSISKQAPKALAYTALMAGWIATEYWYTVGDFSWPWLILGNGFSHDVWAVQWYEYTGVFGGSLWVLLANVLIYEALQARSARRIAAAAFVVLAPICISLAMWCSWEEPAEKVRVAVIQPNVDCYDKFAGDDARQERNIIDLLEDVPADADYIFLPETAVPRYYWEPQLAQYPMMPEAGAFWQELADSLRANHPRAILVTGANTLRQYTAQTKTRTARANQYYGWYDHFNTAVGLTADGLTQLHHKGRLVIGVEKTPMPWLFDALEFLVIDLGGTLGQIGQGTMGMPFTHNGITFGSAICYEGLYGDFYGDFVRRGAQFMAIISNDGWWEDTPGYRHLFTISRLRAIEHRRAIARSANTGRSGFISARGDVGETLGWEQRGVITADVAVATPSEKTFYTRYGDYVGRLSNYLMLLSVLYYIALRIKRKNYLVQ